MEKHRQRNDFGGETKTMGLSLSRSRYDLIKRYSASLQISMAKAIMDNLNFREIERVLAEMPSPETT